VAALMNGDALGSMEDLDDAAGHAHFHLLPEQGVRHRVEEAIDLDVIIERDAGEAPFGVFVSRVRQRAQGWPLDACEQINATDTQSANDVIVHAFQRELDCRVGFLEGEECLTS